ncbi:MAG: energy-coupling factor transporter transmembrane protein EcfT, partial [Lachnospiraceae bacterium]|nr:energy-coupling factor transporter transmembrane protein EcfT [Lachnospiraceae bacterium]
MLRDITLGQYYQAESVIHRLDPRVKLGTTVLFIISLFAFDGFWGYGVAALFLGIVIKLSKVPFKFMVKGMKSIVFLLSVTVIFNLFLTPGEPLVQIWKLSITREGVRLAVLLSIRLGFLIIGSSVMTLTTTPNQLTDGLERMLRPLNKMRVPVHEIAMMMSIA